MKATLAFHLTAFPVGFQREHLQSLALDLAMDPPVVQGGRQSYHLILDASTSTVSSPPHGSQAWQPEKRAVDFLLSQLPDGTRVSLSVFNSQTEQLIHSLELDAKNRKHILQKLDQVHPSGTTNPIQALQQTYASASSDRQLGFQPRTLFMSDGFFDGHAQQGALSAAHAFHQAELPLNAYGLGGETDMQSLSNMSPNAQYLERPEDLMPVLQQQLNQQSGIQKLEISFHPVGDNSRAHIMRQVYPQNRSSDQADSMSILAPEKRLLVLVQLTVTPQVDPGRKLIGHLRLSGDGKLLQEIELISEFVAHAEQIQTDQAVHQLCLLGQVERMNQELLALQNQNNFAEASRKAEQILRLANLLAYQSQPQNHWPVDVAGKARQIIQVTQDALHHLYAGQKITPQTTNRLIAASIQTRK